MTDLTDTQRYDRIAPYYDLAIIPTEAAVRRERRRLLAHAHGCVLEIGIGTGASLPFYPPRCEITGIDPSREMLEKAVSRSVHLHRPVTAMVMTAEALAFADASFDTVVATLVFCSVDDPLQALGEVRRVIRPGGTFLLLEHVRPTGGILAPLFDRLDPWWAQRSCHLNRHTGRLVTQAGFRLRHEQRWGRTIFHAIEATC